MVFEAVDLLLFVCCGINVTALAIYAYKTNKALKDGSLKSIEQEKTIA